MLDKPLIKKNFTVITLSFYNMKYLVCELYQNYKIKVSIDFTLVGFAKGHLNFVVSLTNYLLSPALSFTLFSLSLNICLALSVPHVLRSCSIFIEEHGIVDGIYRLSGVSSNTQKLRSVYSTVQKSSAPTPVYV